MSKQSTPLVSICCLTYNHADFIEQCLDGFLMQEVDFDYEILIHDDASTDATPEILRRYEAAHPDKFRIIYQTENQHRQRIPISYKFQYPRARGKYIAMCEGDDYWTNPHKLATQVAFLEAHPDFSGTFHSFKKLNEHLELIDHHNPLPATGEISGRDFLSKWYHQTATLVFRRDIFDKPHPDPNKYWAGDVWFSCLIATYGRVWGFAEDWSVYRIHQGGISYNSAPNEANLRRELKLWETVLADFPDLAPQEMHTRMARCNRMLYKLLPYPACYPFWKEMLRLRPKRLIRPNTYISLLSKMIQQAFKKS